MATRSWPIIVVAGLVVVCGISSISCWGGGGGGGWASDEIYPHNRFESLSRRDMKTCKAVQLSEMQQAKLKDAFECITESLKFAMGGCWWDVPEPCCRLPLVSYFCKLSVPKPRRRPSRHSYIGDDY